MTRATVLPDALRGSGTITRRQTTFWELSPHGHPPMRVRFHGKVEFACPSTEYAQATLTDAHPLLLDYQHGTQAIYLSGAVEDPEAWLERIDAIVSDLTQGWRDAARYLNGDADPRTVLAGGYGLLLQGPAPLCDAVRAELDGAGIRSSTLGTSPSSRPAMWALVLGRSYVIAEGFAFEPR